MSLFLLVLLIFYAKTQDQYSSCDGTSTISSYAIVQIQQKFRIQGNDMSFCLHFSNLNMKLITKLTLDQYSSLKVSNIFSKVVKSGSQSVTLHAANVTSSQYVKNEVFIELEFLCIFTSHSYSKCNYSPQQWLHYFHRMVLSIIQLQGQRLL